MEKENKKRFVLVHGLCQGAWIWYKVKTLLEAAGHSVTAVDLAASGINMTRLEDIQTLKDYSKPLLDVFSSLGSKDEKVILVAHSMGGISAALAAECFPGNIAALVFLNAAMPDTTNPPAYVVEKFVSSTPREKWLDTVFGTYGRPECPLEFALLGPKCLAKIFYQLSPLEDLVLAKMLVRVNPLVTNNLAGTRSFSEEGYGSVTRIFIDLVLAKMLVRVNPLVTNNLAGTRSFSEEGYGSVTRIFIVSEKDLLVSEDYQRWMIKNFPPKEVMEIKDADHMPMFSKTQELYCLLVEIAAKYA
ncbi:unnamed protein product [Microthlaspi erraticum]|uniref:AB hydrolase-1 domain-containing protein n=1 Tax=Microthlaspi erraticum TaxID=1685480 RepID=A0A6D2IZT9_9BRAS|nr:unnamed protein product [Microthlaspi erraticum]